MSLLGGGRIGEPVRRTLVLLGPVLALANDAQWKDVDPARDRRPVLQTNR